MKDFPFATLFQSAIFQKEKKIKHTRRAAVRLASGTAGKMLGRCQNVIVPLFFACYFYLL